MRVVLKWWELRREMRREKKEEEEIFERVELKREVEMRRVLERE
jgi:hypothetical protein